MDTCRPMHTTNLWINIDVSFFYFFGMVSNVQKTLDMQMIEYKSIWILNFLTQICRTVSVTPRPLVKPPLDFRLRIKHCSIIKSDHSQAQNLSDLRTVWKTSLTNNEWISGNSCGSSSIVCRWRRADLPQWWWPDAAKTFNIRDKHYRCKFQLTYK